MSRKLGVRVCWEWQAPKQGLTFPGFAVEGDFEAGRVHDFYEPAYSDDPSSDLFVHRNLTISSWAPGAALETTERSIRWYQMPIYVRCAFREKIERIFGARQHPYGVFRRRTRGSPYARPIK